MYDDDDDDIKTRKGVGEMSQLEPSSSIFTQSGSISFPINYSVLKGGKTGVDNQSHILHFLTTCKI